MEEQSKLLKANLASKKAQVQTLSEQLEAIKLGYPLIFANLTTKLDFDGHPKYSTIKRSRRRRLSPKRSD